MVEASKEHLLLLLTRPLEPVFVPRGKDKIYFAVPLSFVADRFKSINEKSMSFFQEDGIAVKVKEPISPLLADEFAKLDLHADFTVLNPDHAKIAGDLIEYLYTEKDINQLITKAVFLHDRINPGLYNYALSVVLLHRPDTKDLRPLTLIASFPDRFFSQKLFSKSLENSLLYSKSKSPSIVIPPEWTAFSWEDEQRVAYFREDIGVNLHHWHYHMVYPFSGLPEIVNKDRRGELFSFMHQQMVARYNFERICNYLKKVEPLANFNESIKEAYFSKLTSKVSSQEYGVRPTNLKLGTMNRGDRQIDVALMERWRERIHQAIGQGVVLDKNGNTIKLTEKNGIDILGNIVQASQLSPNREYYGNIHNEGHVWISNIHDPDYRYKEASGVMSYDETAVRDPVFFRWHCFIDDIFDSFKQTLPPYELEELEYPGIKLESVVVKSDSLTNNNLQTYWEKSIVELSSGMDFQNTTKTEVTFLHLQHKEFDYNITAINSTTDLKKGTCRIFLSPFVNDREIKWNYDGALKEQRRMFIEMDKFTVTLKPGTNTITRHSTESSVTIPFEQIFNEKNTSTKPESGFCGCGWPHYMLIPKGRSEGMRCILFVMISDYEKDKIEKQSGSESDCKEAFSFCGLKNKKYPDARAMGYPFDRLPKSKVDTLKEFLTPNMRTQEVTIVFDDSQ